jgi:predicted HicB family RNase H-like nuclease
MKELKLRLPDDLHARLVKAARREQRSLNGEITWLLTQALPETTGSSPP